MINTGKQPSKSHAALRHPRRLQLLYLAVCLLTLYVLLPQLHVFQHGFANLSNINIGYCLLAVVSVALTYLLAAGTYFFLAAHPLSYPKTVLVQLASMFTNRLLPGGLGGIGTNYLYLHKNQHSPAQASGVVAANNSLGFAGHAILVAATLIATRRGLDNAHLPSLNHMTLLVGAGAFVVLIILLGFVPRMRSAILRGFRGFSSQLLSYRHHPDRLLLALLCSLCLTTDNVASLWFSLYAVGISLSFVAVLLVFTLGITVGTATPTPGGLGGIEAGLIAGLVAYRIDSGAALAAVLLYRLASYWLPLVIGAVAFAITSRHGYFS